MVRRKTRSGGHPGWPVGSLLAVSLCLAWGLLLVTAGAALGISGFASPTSSVRAQYPDSGGPPGQPPVVSSLGSLIRLRRQIDRDPNAAARQREIGREAARALLSTAGIDARQSGSIVLLMVGIGVLSVGGVLRWHRGRANI